jgi:hypothetical protein
MPLPRRAPRGKYQVMGKDLRSRLADANVPPMTPAQFLANPQAQEQQFEQEFGGLMSKYASFNDAASVWLSGRPFKQAGNASDGYMTVPQYVGKANVSLNKWQAANPQTASTGAQLPPWTQFAMNVPPGMAISGVPVGFRLLAQVPQELPL